MSAIPYYWVNPKGRAYWRPNKRMMSLGLGCVSLGVAGPEAEEQALVWNRRWQEIRRQPRELLRVRIRVADRGAANYIYFLQIADRIKIGTSRNPLSRIQDLASSAHARPGRTVIIRGSRADEKRLHARFRAYRTGGEWFVASHSLLLTMSRCAMAGHVIHDGAEPGTAGGPESNFSDLGVESASEGRN